MFTVSKHFQFKKSLCQKWDLNPHLHVETRILNNWEGDNILSLAP